MPSKVRQKVQWGGTKGKGTEGTGRDLPVPAPLVPLPPPAASWDIPAFAYLKTSKVHR
jgi:hypothetical protein